jgi:HPt (histidine-containing phosphotransfer) domain-containing protein
MKKIFDIEGAGQVRRKVITFPTAESRLKDGIFDIRAINNIREVEQQTGKLLLPSILEGFTSQMQEKLQELSQNIVKGDARVTFRTACAIKSISMSIGAEKVRLISSNLEAGFAAGELTDVDQSIASLSDAFEEFVEHFSKEFISNNRDLI